MTTDWPAVASFRDPAGRLWAEGGRIFRTLNAAGEADLRAFLDTAAAARLLDAGAVVRTEFVSDTVVEHERIPFVSFPYEWAPEMLHAAAVLTLDLARALLPEGMGLKDATPYNVLFRGARPVFVDLLSFERRRPDDPVWLAYGQFTRTFLLPLLANQRLGLDLKSLLLTRRDGLEPEDLYRWGSGWQRCSPAFLPLVSIPKWLGNRAAPRIYRPQHTDPEKARFLLESLLARLRRTLRKLQPRPGRSIWSDYPAQATHVAAKQAFIGQFLAEQRPRRVLDLGCNTGHFSLMAARAGAGVVAVDSDAAVVGKLWHTAQAERLDILPLVVNLSQPTPAMGWCNREYPSFVERARGGFDTVFMLAILHHLLVSDAIPLPEILQLAAGLTTRFLVIEYISPDDPLFQRLTRGREDLHRYLTAAHFESACHAHFDIVSRCPDGTRTLYVLSRKCE